MKHRLVRRGEIYYADLDGYRGCEQGGIRPVLIIQNNEGNYHSPTTIIAPITTKQGGEHLPVHVNIGNCGHQLADRSQVLLEQIRVIDKSRLRQYSGSMYESEMRQIDKALLISVGLGERND
jgi:mRNA interferase MazF